MKIIKSSLIYTVLATSLFIHPKALAQSTPQLCQIHNGNVGNYVSQYNVFNNSTPTPYRPFIFNNQTYKVTQNLIATPLFYTSLSNNNFIAAFQLKGNYGNFVIDKQVVTQLIKQNLSQQSVQVLGICVNGVFVPTPQQVFNFIDLPLKTKQALYEAQFGIIQEQTGNMFK